MTNRGGLDEVLRPTRNTIPINYLLYGTTTSSSALKIAREFGLKTFGLWYYDSTASGPADFYSVPVT